MWSVDPIVKVLNGQINWVYVNKILHNDGWGPRTWQFTKIICRILIGPTLTLDMKLLFSFIQILHYYWTISWQICIVTLSLVVWNVDQSIVNIEVYYFLLYLRTKRNKTHMSIVTFVGNIQRTVTKRMYFLFVCDCGLSSPTIDWFVLFTRVFCPLFALISVNTPFKALQRLNDFKKVWIVRMKF